VKVYIAGKITDNPDFIKDFAEAEQEMLEQGCVVMNPAALPMGFDYEDYMNVCFALIDV